MQTAVWLAGSRVRSSFTLAVVGFISVDISNPAEIGKKINDIYFIVYVSYLYVFVF